MKDFDNNFYDLFLFDPWPDYSEIKFGVRAIRKKLIQIRNELNLEERFCKEMNLLLSKNIRQLNDELIIISLQE